jgi:hypothetical protein
MISLEPSMPRHKIAFPFPSLAANHLIGKGDRCDRVPPTDGHHRGRQSWSRALSGNDQQHQQLPEAAPAQNPGRRIGAGAGATSVFVAMIRHDTCLVRSFSLVGRSRTCPFFLLVANIIANPKATGIRN